MSLSSARVIHLPTAVSQPVQQAPRRGRFPKCVTTLVAARFLVFQRVSERSELLKEIELLEHSARIAIDTANNLRREAAGVREKVRACGVAL